MRNLLLPHHVETVFERGWSLLTNGALLAKAEEAGFDVFVTTDKNLRHQQNLSQRHLAIVVLSTTSWPRIRIASTVIHQTLKRVVPGRLVEVEIPENATPST